MSTQFLNLETQAEILGKFPIFMAYRCLYEPPFLSFTEVSDGCESLTGYSAGELTSGNFYLTAIVHPDDTERVKSRHNTALSVGAPVESGFRILTKNGTEKWVLSRARVAKTDSQGMPHIIEGFLICITKEIKSEATSTANRTNHDFLSSMGYAVRTPMNAILGLTEISLRTQLPQHIREYSQLVRKAGHKLMSALDNIADYKNIESGNLKIVIQEYSLTSLIIEVIDKVKEHLGDLDFHVFVDSTLPRTLEGDVARVQQVLMNLLSNAIKFTDKGFVSFSVEGDVSGNTANLVFTVEDTGRGIKESDYENLFKAFTQFDMKTIEGTGLGLNITRGLLKLMNGDISIASGFGVGSVATVTLPQEICGDKNPFCHVANAQNINALILEENPAYAASISRTIKNLGAKCTTVSTAKDLLQELSNAKYSHIFADAHTYAIFLWNDLPALKPDCDAKIVLISESEGEDSSDDLSLSKPVFCLPVADIFNNAAQSALKKMRTWFIAPKARVLVVDDIGANFTVANAFLMPYRMKVDYVDSGEQALDAVKQKKYDLILMDHLMPAMTGTKAIQLIRKITDANTDCKNVPIIMLSANNDHQSKELFARSGANDFLPKPIVANALNAVAKKWIPKELQKPLTEAEVSAPLQSPTFSIVGVDTLRGVVNSGGNIDTYLQVLKRFYAQGSSIAANLTKYADLCDMENYRVHVHALAGLSASIGADEIASAAYRMEISSAKGDADFVCPNTPVLISGLENLLKNIQPVVSGVTTEASKKAASEVDKKKILIIDDTDVYLFMLDEILADTYETLSCLDGEDGLETAKLTMPDLILLDLIMPGKSGYEVLEAIRADEKLKHVPVVLMSAAQQDKERGASLGSSGYIQKPFEAAVVKSTIDSIIN